MSHAAGQVTVTCPEVVEVALGRSAAAVVSGPRSFGASEETA
jgi:hypothetical protein